MSSSPREYPLVPRVGVGAVVFRDGKVLLVRRGIPPSEGLWAIPGGLLELGESLAAGAEREIREETGVVIRAGAPCDALEFREKDEAGRIRYHYIIVDLWAVYVSGEPAGADDAQEARWLSPAELVCLPVANNTLRLLRKLGFLPPAPPDRGAPLEG